MDIHIFKFFLEVFKIERINVRSLCPLESFFGIFNRCCVLIKGNDSACSDPLKKISGMPAASQCGVHINPSGCTSSPSTFVSSNKTVSCLNIPSHPISQNLSSLQQSLQNYLQIQYKSFPFGSVPNLNSFGNTNDGTLLLKSCIFLRLDGMLILPPLVHFNSGSTREE